MTYWNEDANFDPRDDATDKGRRKLQVQDKKDQEEGGEARMESPETSDGWRGFIESDNRQMRSLPGAE